MVFYKESRGGSPEWFKGDIKLEVRKILQSIKNNEGQSQEHTTLFHSVQFSVRHKCYLVRHQDGQIPSMTLLGLSPLTKEYLNHCICHIL